jgi:hypothetical protein
VFVCREEEEEEESKIFFFCQLLVSQAARGHGAAQIE